MISKKYDLNDVFGPAQKARASIFEKTSIRPKIAIVLGSGIQVFTQLKEHTSISYNEIDSFPETTVKGHKGVVTMGIYEDVPIAIFRGRFHRYEGHPWRNVVFPITLMHEMGIQNVVMTNSAGGLNRFFHPGDLMLIRDHIYWQYPSLEEQNCIYQQVGNRHQHRYSDALNNLAVEASREEKVALRFGVYSCLTGPTYETRGETLQLAHLGADAMGMSTVPEALWAGCLNMDVLGISCITNVAITPDQLAETSHHEVVTVAQSASAKLDRLLKYIVTHI